MGEQTWMYRRKGEEVEGKIFDSEAIPEGEGWVDSPSKVDEAPQDEGGEEKPKRRRKAAAAVDDEGGEE